MENKQTAVEFIETELRKLNISIDSGIQVSVIRILEQAKEMEKEQMNAIFDKGYKCGIEDYIDIQKGYDGKSISFEQYYNEIYGTK